MDITARAYAYAVNKKAVSEKVIEAWKNGYETGKSDITSMSVYDLLKIIRGRFRSKDEIERDLGMNGIWRGLNDEEILEANQFKIFNDLMKEYE